MKREDAFYQYQEAQREGKKYYDACVSAGKYPYIQVLEDILNQKSTTGQFHVATLEIPIERIVGSVAHGRVNAFAGNFMPLLKIDTEFSDKWISLIREHEEHGINDPIKVIEYMGLFYVQEGHKRVSVLRYEQMPTILADVYRLLPPWSDEAPVRAAYELSEFFKLSGTYRIYFSRPGCYKLLQSYMGFAPDHVWTTEERQTFHGVFWGFKVTYQKVSSEMREKPSADEALLAYLKLFPYNELTNLPQPELAKRLSALLPQLSFLSNDEPVAVSTEPAAVEKSVLEKLVDGLTRTTLKTAFIYASDPKTSDWSGGHKAGQDYLAQRLGDRIRIKEYIVGENDADAVMEEAADDGAQLVFATAPTLLMAARRLAAKYPAIKVLVCALSVPYADVRTYYCRMFEAKFLTGAIAGSLWMGGSIGYIARYPILGEPASINAFALGVRMTAPFARIELSWSSQSTDPWAELIAKRARIISLYETTLRHSADGDEMLPMSTVMMQPSGKFEPIASACYDWGEMYVQLANNVLNGGWGSTRVADANAISYWWGMDSGAIDIRLSDSVPAGVRQLAAILRQDMREGQLKPFTTFMRDQDGNVRNDGKRLFSAEELMRMNWLLDSVSGRIPTEEELLPMSRETTRLLSLNPEEQKM
ncbi:MAG: BMP family ABC transporter substrate-binding protein [Clostridia bacterium]|nr:BMP family ABC transporter substrate-binding protein [Clostridia bacterium]